MTPQMFKCSNVQTLAFTVLLTLFLAASTLSSQTYFPPKGSDVWETVTLDELGWCKDKLDSLIDHLRENDTKAFIVLKDGRIAVEWYASDFTKDDNWYWASAGKVVTATLVGILREQRVIDIDQPSRRYLGNGWTSLTDEQEEAITVWHHLTMTSGLDDGTGDPYCTDPDCLVYMAEPGTRWAYHNAPYTLLDGVIEGASAKTLNSQFITLLSQPTGMNGAFLKQGFNNVLFSTPRAMARFGLLALNNFVWDGDTILGDQEYITSMVTPSQDLNRSYGYLWWLNGQESFMLPRLQFTFPGPITPNAPADAYYGLGKNDQIVCVVPSENIVVVRMGNAASPDGPDVATTFANEMWDLIRGMMCMTTSMNSDGPRATSYVRGFEVYDVQGRYIIQVAHPSALEQQDLRSGLYLLRETSTGRTSKWFQR